jgi:hypothetical protein
MLERNSAHRDGQVVVVVAAVAVLAVVLVVAVAVSHAAKCDAPGRGSRREHSELLSVSGQQISVVCFSPIPLSAEQLLKDVASEHCCTVSVQRREELNGLWCDTVSTHKRHNTAAAVSKCTEVIQ